MGGGDDDAGVKAKVPNQVSDARRSNHAGGRDFARGGRQASGQSIGDPSTRLAGVLADNYARAPVITTKVVSESAANRKHRVSVQRKLACNSANSIGAEKFSTHA